MRTPTPWSWQRPSVIAVCWLLSLPLAATAQREPPAPPPPGSSPNNPDADARARKLFEQGRAAFADGHYRDAWEHFREAYILSKRPELLYNVGQSADRMRMDREALAAFKLYLEKLPNAPNRREVESRIVWLEDRLAREGNGEENPTTLSEMPDDLGTDGDAPAQSPESLEDDPSEPAEKDEVEVPAEDTHGQPERTKWYVRAAAGLGLLADSLGDSAADSLGSITFAGLLSVGYDIHDGVVIGGGLALDWGLSPSAKQGDATADIDTANLSMIIAFVDYYLAPRQHGWHLLGGLGVGSLSLSDKSATVGIEDATGGGIVLGGGCEWPLDREWAVGALARVVIARLDTDTAKHTAFTPSVAVTAAWY